MCLQSGENGCNTLKTASTAKKAKRSKEGARRQQKRLWVRQIFQTRSTRGEYHSLISEMRLGDHERFYKYFHKTP